VVGRRPRATGRTTRQLLAELVEGYFAPVRQTCPRCRRTLPAFEFARVLDHPTIKMLLDTVCRDCREGT
jgi:hypothetical protein